MMQVKNLDFSTQFTKTLELLESGRRAVFLTGHAGTGKSTLLEHFRSTTKKQIVVLAPTGVAALNVKGQTIHSFFGFRPGITPEVVKRDYHNRGKKGFYKLIEAIVIDEISMVRADLLDCIDAFLRLHGPDRKLPFGGVRLIFVGDLYQLPPVVMGNEEAFFNGFYESPYFFSAKVMKDLELELIELDKIYRQDDQQFIGILDGIRKNALTAEQLTELNHCHKEGFSFDGDDLYIYLTTTNKQADQVNQNFLSKLETKKHIFAGKREGGFDEKLTPNSQKLELKVGAQVMLINNDRAGRWVNGSIGKISEIVVLGPGKDIVVVELDGGELVEVLPYTWEVFKFVYNPALDGLRSESVGSYTQYPLILSWAITIHKSQGKTFDKVAIDFGWGTFAHGQAYVALSRCRSLAGTILTKPFKISHIIADSRIGKFFSEFAFSKKPWELDPNDHKRLLEGAIGGSGLLKVKTQSEQGVGEYLLNPTSLSDDGVIAGYCHRAGGEVLLRLGEIVELEAVQGIN